MTNTSHQNFEIANTIYNQLGGIALFALGAKDFVADRNYLQFRIRGSKRFTHIGIALNGKDLYDITFYKIRAHEVLEHCTQQFNDYYADQMHALIEEQTGLACLY